MNDIYTISMLISIATFTITTYVSPGPTNIILLSSVLNFGYKKTVPFMLANVISYPLMMLAIGLGVGMLLTQNQTIMTVLKVVGISYLCWMAYKIAMDSSSYDTSDSNETQPFTFWQGFVYPWINPKAWIVNTSAISIFVTSTENSLMQVSIIVLFILLAMIITVYTWSIGGIVLKRFINNEKFIKKMNLVLALLLVSSIIPIL